MPLSPKIKRPKHAISPSLIGGGGGGGGAVSEGSEGKCSASEPGLIF